MTRAPVQDRGGHVAPATKASVTQRMARSAAMHPWRIVTAWGLVVVSSVVLIVTLFGSAFTSDASLTTNPDSARAAKIIGDNFAQGDRIDEAVIVHSDQ